MKVRKKQLLLAAGIIWGFAGINILRIGILAYRQNWSVRNALISLAVFAVFRAMVFGKLVKKHTARIMNYTEEKQVGEIPKRGNASLTMAFMMSFGISIRMSGIWPDSWIAVFYTGLGTALFLAGTGFISRYIKVHSLGRRSAAAEM